MTDVLSAEVTSQLDALDPLTRQQVEELGVKAAFDAALAITEGQALGDGKFLELLLKLLESFLPILIQIFLKPT